jgi:hypothetical protein
MRYIELYEGLTVTVLADSATYRLMLRQGFCAIIVRDYRQVQASNRARRRPACHITAGAAPSAIGCQATAPTSSRIGPGISGNNDINAFASGVFTKWVGSAKLLLRWNTRLDVAK